MSTTAVTTGVVLVHARTRTIGTAYGALATAHGTERATGTPTGVLAAARATRPTA